MLIADFNQLPADEAREIVRVWADVPAWTRAIVEARPFDAAEDLEDLAGRLAKGWTEADLDAALAHHPRIGDRVLATGPNAAHARREQSSVQQAATDVAQRLADGNAAYEEKFGRVFLIRAAGRSPEQILAELERRLTSDPETEWREAASQLAQIARLRLEDTIDESAVTEGL